MSDRKKPGEVVDFTRANDEADARRHARREAKASVLKSRFAKARRCAESKTRAAERLKKLFKQPRSRPPGKD